MISKVQKDFGNLDILCNNVGIQYVAPVHEFPDDKWDAMIAITLSSAFHATKAALPAMIEQEWGRIINTGSMHALVASPYKSAYNAAKHGIAGMSKPAMHITEYPFSHVQKCLHSCNAAKHACYFLVFYACKNAL